ncbi:PREDICTED: ubiquitin carboxyl-terminal hydrolase 49 [Bison bison bison]|uniref:Ubiquitin carboxyl-terminal hydrolase 49 n=1 Tax=Bison bison bison TaxID=43346 RepID=A0A6P3JDV3_BISBB|nr:PREDICTED: ubiquitin carboxyl-terminal hydrolase 49 [Bison bison bison]
MDRCKHVGRLRLAQDHSILNPQKWYCRECATTESVWACLKCSHVACGRYIEDHALKHFEETRHPLAMEVRDLYVFCYLCKDYVLNDNPEGDLKLLRSSLLAVRGQTQDPPLRRGRTLRSMAAGEDAVPPQRAPQGQPPMLTALILQVLSHLRKFRECFLNLDPSKTEQLFPRAANGKAPLSGRPASSSATELSSTRSDGAEACEREGLCLNGGTSLSRSLELIQNKEPSSKHISLCHELHTLFRVMWSGKWALVSPFAMLHSVWSLIPAFRGYDQQDAQEFLCELLHKVQQELESEGTTRRILIPFSQRKLTKQVLKVVNTIFHGQLLSQVTCVSCNYKSNTIEPFWDLSLEFPERYHCIEKGFVPLNQTECLLTEMLAKFTETEALEGRIYACDQCNSKRRKSNPKPLVLSEARKQLMIYRLPQVLRLHLKRFRWSGRNHREKIGVHVVFDQVLTMEPYCCRDMLSSLDKETFAYDLSAVVMHHGKGFGSGHYTAYCYNTEGGFWVHCNDSKLNVCSVEEVCKTQAYILFYTQRTVQGNARISETQLQTQVHSSNNDEGRPRTFP